MKGQENVHAIALQHSHNGEANSHDEHILILGLFEKHSSYNIALDIIGNKKLEPSQRDSGLGGDAESEPANYVRHRRLA